MSVAPHRVRLTWAQALSMLGPYAWSRIVEQIRSVSLIVCYLVLFQLLVLGIPVAEAAVVSLGIGVVVIGLAFFMEGLFLGLMPLGEVCGVQLPRKTVLPVILLFAFLLGMGATFAEPAIGVLRTAGASVRAWDAPLLFLLLNRHADLLVWAVGGGVGLAVLFGMLRFLYDWSLKPFVFVLYALILGVSVFAYFDANLLHITGLAWDCGAVTTGPVTVPLVLALGIGITRAASKGEGGGAGGFGVVTLASAFPILAVAALGLILRGDVPAPMSDVDFSKPAQRAQVAVLFEGETALRDYVLRTGSDAAQLAFFGGDVHALEGHLDAAAAPEAGVADEGGLQRLARNSFAALQAIVPLSLFLVVVLYGVLRERVPRLDEMVLGIGFAVVGMSLFGLGIELGLSRLGGEIGANLPSAFKAVEQGHRTEVIRNFDPEIVTRAITADGEVEAIFHRKTGDGYEALPYHPEDYDPRSGRYHFTPVRGPLFPEILGILVVIAFGFMMGYGATLAEPALNALGTTVEELTVGTFHKRLLMQAVAVGVGIGIAFGVAKIIYDWPLIWMLAPPYAALMVLTAISSEEFVNIGWDSAGVTTGPVTVPLVLAMGLGISGQTGSIEGFGILALASVWPILAVLTVGLSVTRTRQAEKRDAEA